MVRLLILSVVFLAGCSLNINQPAVARDLKPLWIRANNVTNGGSCERGWQKVKEYFRGRGIEVLHSDCADLSLLCISWTLAVSASGRSYFPDKAAVVYSSGISSTHTAKVMIHEINHLLGQMGHEWLTIMNPVTETYWLMSE